MPCVYRRSIHVFPPLTNRPYSLPVFIESAASFTIYIILPQSLPTHKCFEDVKEEIKLGISLKTSFKIVHQTHAVLKSFTIS